MPGRRKTTLSLRWEQLLDAIETRVLWGAAKARSDARREAAATARRREPSAEVGGARAVYLGQVSHAAYQITDETVDALRAEGAGEDAIYELTIAAAFTAGQLRYELGMRALRAARKGGRER